MKRKKRILAWGVRQSYYFEPTFTFHGILILPSLMSSLHYAVEGRDGGCGYPPSFARSQKIGNGTLGIEKEGMYDALFSYI